MSATGRLTFLAVQPLIICSHLLPKRITGDGKCQGFFEIFYLGN
jgi:hypothetical protein